MDYFKNKVEAIYKWGNWDGQLKLKIYSAPLVIKVMPVKNHNGIPYNNLQISKNLR